MVKWPPTLRIKFGHGHWITKLNSTQFGVFWQLRKDRYSQTARIFCRQQLGPIKGPGSPGVRLLRHLEEGVSWPQTHGFLWITSQLTVHIAFLFSSGQLSVSWCHPNCVEEYSEVRCAVMDVLDVFILCRFLQAVCQVAAIGCKKIQEGPTPMSRMLTTMNSSFHLNSMTWFFGTNCRQNFTQTVALGLFQPFSV